MLRVLFWSPLKTVRKDGLALQLVHECILVDGCALRKSLSQLHNFFWRVKIGQLEEWVGVNPTKLHQVLRELNESKNVLAGQPLVSVSDSQLCDKLNAFFKDDVEVGRHSSKNILEVLAHGWIELSPIDQA